MSIKNKKKNKTVVSSDHAAAVSVSALSGLFLDSHKTVLIDFKDTSIFVRL